jgi:hypothetical protein
MAIRATCLDDNGTLHVVIGLNRANIEALLQGQALTLPPSDVLMTEASRIAIIFAETDEELINERIPPRVHLA